MIKWAKKKAEASSSDFFIFVTKTQNKKTDPLSHENKIDVLNAMGLRHCIGHTDKYTIFDVVKTLQEKYSSLEFVVGGDQYKSFSTMFEKWGHEYTAKLSVIKFEDRNKYPISATQMREYAKDGNWIKFVENCPNVLSPNQSLEMYRKVSVALQGQVRNTNDITGSILSSQGLYD